MKNPTNLNIKITIIASLLISTAMLTACISKKTAYQGNQKIIIKNNQGIPNAYMVKPEDTVSKIAETFGLKYRDIAKLNDLDSEYTIYAGQWLTLWNNKKIHTKTKNSYVKSSKSSSHKTSNRINNNFVVNNSTGYQYPTNNQIIQQFGSRGSDGMWFKGKVGDPVYATSVGKVMYAGSGLQEFGNLIMIRHDDNLITAYAHNSRLLVQEGAYVKRGQKIAVMGKTGDTRQIGLQLQVRQNGSAIDPRSILGKR